MPTDTLRSTLTALRDDWQAQIRTLHDHDGASVADRFVRSLSALLASLPPEEETPTCQHDWNNCGTDTSQCRHCHALLCQCCGAIAPISSLKLISEAHPVAPPAPPTPLFSLTVVADMLDRLVVCSRANTTGNEAATCICSEPHELDRASLMASILRQFAPAPPTRETD